jgi:Tfp pilus assembly protein PilF
LYAVVLANEPLNVKKAKGYLETAMKMDPSYLPAVYQMAEILHQQQAYDKGIEM